MPFSWCLHTKFFSLSKLLREWSQCIILYSHDSKNTRGVIPRTSTYVPSYLNSLTLTVVGSPQMTLQQYFATCCPQGIPKLYSCHCLSFYFLFLSTSHLVLRLPLFLATFTAPCRNVFTMPEDREMWPYYLSFRFFTMVAFWILLRTSSFVAWSL